MKCLYFVQYFPPEKASGLDLVEDLIEGFAQHGWNVELFTPTPLHLQRITSALGNYVRKYIRRDGLKK